jgi:hypothetical protein
MIALQTEGVGRRLTGRRQLPAAAVGELEAGAGVGAGAGGVPLSGHRDLLREVQGNGPAAKSSCSAVGNGNVHLEEGAARVRRRCRTGVRGECLISQHKAGQQHSQFDQSSSHS